MNVKILFVFLETDIPFLLLLYPLMMQNWNFDHTKEEDQGKRSIKTGRRSKERKKYKASSSLWRRRIFYEFTMKDKED
jgi:hypothetical protein